MPEEVVIPEGFTEVESSALLAVKMQETSEQMDALTGKPEITEIITVIFPKGVRWRYEGVPRGTFHAMLTSESIGKFFAAKVKSKYRAVKEWPLPQEEKA